MKIVLTGAGGFLGQNLIQTCILLESDIEIIALSSQEQQLSLKYNDFKKWITFYNSNEYHKINWEEIDILLNCAFPRNENGQQIATGLTYISDILENAVSNGVKSVINISSQSVYSQIREDSADENTPLNLESKYAIGKYASELLVNKICKNIPHTNLRLASLIGIGFDQRITNKLVKQVINHQDIQIVDGNQIFSFLDVRDAANALISVILSSPKIWKETYNLGSSETYTLKELANAVVFIGKTRFNTDVDLLIQKDSSWKNLSMNCSRFYKDFNWRQVYRLQDTVNDLFLKEIKQRDLEL